MSNKKILIVEDDPVIVISLEFLMKENGYETILTNNGEDAISKAKSEKPDLILLDIMLPNRSGLDVCQTLRNQSEYDSVKIVLLTAKGREVDVNKGISFGADAYITKPFSTRELVRKVEELLGEAQ